MEGRSRRTPRVSAPGENRPLAAAPGPSDPMPAQVEPATGEPPAIADEPALAQPTAASDAEAASAPTPSAAEPAEPAEPKPVDHMLAAIDQSRTALARGLDSIGEEVASLARHNFDASARAAIQLLGAKTWADAFAVNSGLARTSLDHWLDSTAKVSELGIRLAIDCSKPLASEWGRVWGRSGAAG
jgi:hypothetical protein